MAGPIPVAATPAGTVAPRRGPDRPRRSARVACAFAPALPAMRRPRRGDATEASGASTAPRCRSARHSSRPRSRHGTGPSRRRSVAEVDDARRDRAVSAEATACGQVPARRGAVGHDLARRPVREHSRASAPSLASSRLDGSARRSGRTRWPPPASSTGPRVMAVSSRDPSGARGALAAGPRAGRMTTARHHVGEAVPSRRATRGRAWTGTSAAGGAAQRRQGGSADQRSDGRPPARRAPAGRGSATLGLRPPEQWHRKSPPAVARGPWRARATALVRPAEPDVLPCPTLPAAARMARCTSGASALRARRPIAAASSAHRRTPRPAGHDRPGGTRRCRRGRPATTRCRGFSTGRCRPATTAAPMP